MSVLKWHEGWNATFYGVQQFGEFTIGFLASGVLAAALGPSPLGVHLTFGDRLGIFAVAVALFRIAFSFAMLRQNSVASSVIRGAIIEKIWVSLLGAFLVLLLLVIAAFMFFGVGNPTESHVVEWLRSMIASLMGKPERVELTQLSVSALIVLTQLLIYLPLWGQESLIRHRVASLPKQSLDDSQRQQALALIVYLDRWVQLDGTAVKFLLIIMALFLYGLFVAVNTGGDVVGPLNLLHLSTVLVAFVSIGLSFWDIRMNSSLYGGEFVNGAAEANFRP